MARQNLNHPGQSIAPERIICDLLKTADKLIDSILAPVYWIAVSDLLRKIKLAPYANKQSVYYVSVCRRFHQISCL